MGEREDAVVERMSRGMVEGVRPVRYWRRQQTTLDSLEERVEQGDLRVTEMERQLAVVRG